MRLQASINGTVFHARLEENPLTVQLAELCPIEIQMQARGGHEYYGRLPESLSQKGCQTMGMDGGKIGPMVALAAVMAQEKPSS